jgi:PPOX class probable F420-dependent enzyme
MAAVLSDKALALLKERYCGVLSTLNKDGSSQLTTMWYFLDENGSITMSTMTNIQKTKNLRRDPRIAICVQDDMYRSVTLSGTVEVSDDPADLQRVIPHLINRYIEDEEARKQYLTTFQGQTRVVLQLKPEKVLEFFL